MSFVIDQMNKTIQKSQENSAGYSQMRCTINYVLKLFFYGEDDKIAVDLFLNFKQNEPRVFMKNHVY